MRKVNKGMHSGKVRRLEESWIRTEWGAVLESPELVYRVAASYALPSAIAGQCDVLVLW